MKTGDWIGFGVAALAIGGVVYVETRKQASAATTGTTSTTTSVPTVTTSSSPTTSTSTTPTRTTSTSTSVPASGSTSGSSSAAVVQAQNTLSALQQQQALMEKEFQMLTQNAQQLQNQVKSLTAQLNS